MDTILFQTVLKFVDSVRECHKVVHLHDLTTNVEVKAHELHILQLVGQRYHHFHILHCNAEFILGQPCGDIGMGVSPYVRIYAKAHLCHFLHSGGYFIDDFQFRNAFHIEVLNASLQPQFYLPIAFSHTRENNFGCRESGIQTSLDFTTTYAVGSKASLCYVAQHLGVCACLNGIMQVIPLVSSGFLLNGMQSLVKQFRIVIVERRSNRTELLYKGGVIL